MSVNTLSSSIPFQVCKRKDQDINQSLKSAIQSALALLKNGLPEYKIAPIQPFIIPSSLVPAKPPLNYDQKYKNWIINNFASSTIKEAQINLDDSEFSLTLIAHNPEISAQMEYRFDNALLDGVDVSSKGVFSYVYNEMEFQVDLKGKIDKRNANEVITVADVKFNIISMEEFSSKFKSDESDKAQKLCDYYNDNAQYLVATEKELYEKCYANVIKDIANDVFSKFPADALFIK